MSLRYLTSTDTLVVASHNQGKVREIGDLLKPFQIKVISAAELQLEEPEETGLTFADNAHLKAEAAAKASGFPALSDDSGLEVHALNGDPGLYSARWAGPSKDFRIAMAKVKAALAEKGVELENGSNTAAANFICVLCLCWPDGKHQLFEGKVYGHLVWPARGDKGFGYDPMFIPEGEVITFGEMEAEKKHGMSHRARAFQLFVDTCFEKGRP